MATEQTVESLTDILMPGGKAPGKAGSTEETRVLNGGIKAAQDFFDSVAEGALPINKPTYPGTMVELPGGGTIGLRPVSKSGDAAIDVNNVPGVSYNKIHFGPN